MPIKYFLFVLFLVLGGFFAQAEVFVVVSNQDSGPGTLREAIIKAKANGTGETDYIHFNLPGNTRSDRTIVIAGDLPNLSDNIVIDGTTQPGDKLGVSDAKVIITSHLTWEDNVSRLYFFRLINVEQIEILGLSIQFNQDNWVVGYGIFLDNARNITIGRPDKGNVLNGFKYCITQGEESVEDIVIQSNIIGIEEDGVTHHIYGRANTKSIWFTDVKNLQVGGNDPSEGNVIFCLYESISVTGAGDMLIAFNKIGLDYTGTEAFSVEGSAIVISGEKAKVAITDNQISAEHSVGITLSDLQDKFIIKRNKIGTDITGTNILSHCNIGISVYRCRAGLIGGSVADANVIAGTAYAAVNLKGSYQTTISKNSMFCNLDGIRLDWDQIKAGRKAPFINITGCNGKQISGIATPNSIIELFEPDACGFYNCQGKRYLKTIKADAEGKWVYKTPGNTGVIATATDGHGATSESSSGKVDENNVIVTPAACGKANGSITGLKILRGYPFHWEDGNGNIVGYDTSLVNVSPGEYTLVLSNGSCKNQGCVAYYGAFRILDVSPAIDITRARVEDASCGQKNGLITGMVLTGQNLRINWLNAAEEVIGTKKDLIGVGPGSYMMKITDTVNGCSATAGPFAIGNDRGPELDISQAVVTDATCSNSNGSIQKIKIKDKSGAAFAWFNQNNIRVGNSVDLSNVPGGKYVLKVTSQGSCPVVVSDSFTIADAGTIDIDLGNMKVVPSNCNSNTGAISGIQIEHGDMYKWINQKGGIVAQTSSLSSVGPGSYSLYITNAVGCEAKTQEITVPEVTPAQMNVYQISAIQPKCNKKNGAVKDILINGGTPVAFEWINRAGKVVGTRKKLEHVGPGKYDLFVTDAKGCKQLVTSATLIQPALPQINENQVLVTSDHCNSGKGSIDGIKLVGEAPFTYLWVNQQNQPVGNQINLRNVPAGDYRLLATDQWGCEVSGSAFDVGNKEVPIAMPAYDDLTIVKGMTAILRPKYPAGDVSGYYLYASMTDSQPLSHNTSGTFSIPNLVQSTSFYIEGRMDNCKSDRVAVHIKVVNGVKVFVPTAFSPNGDRKNDWFRFIAHGLESLDYFKVYNRWGLLVFYSKDSSTGWDGTLKGNPQPMGTYVWILRGKGVNGELIERHGVVTLLR